MSNQRDQINQMEEEPENFLSHINTKKWKELEEVVRCG